MEEEKTRKEYKNLEENFFYREVGGRIYKEEKRVFMLPE
jgi:hypothetical protein